MTPKEAYLILKKTTTRVAKACREFPEFYAFFMVEKEHFDEDYVGGFDTVNKTTGKIDAFSPVEDFDAYFKSKPIDIKELG